jgi:hypothetical protein
MDRDYMGEAAAELAENDSAKRWVQARVEEIHRTVTTYDVLKRFGVSLRYGDGRREQFPCPFHGSDNKPSARVYPTSERVPSHAWCFVCQERWDVITLWKKFTNFEGRFSRLLAEIEKTYGIKVPEAPPAAKDLSDTAKRELDELFEICERRMRASKRAFTRKGFLTVGSILDRLYSQVEAQQVPIPKAREVISKVLAKIGEKVRECPEG